MTKTCYFCKESHECMKDVVYLILDDFYQDVKKAGRLCFIPNDEWLEYERLLYKAAEFEPRIPPINYEVE